MMVNKITFLELSAFEHTFSCVMQRIHKKKIFTLASNCYIPSIFFRSFNIFIYLNEMSLSSIYLTFETQFTIKIMLYKPISASVHSACAFNFNSRQEYSAFHLSSFCCFIVNIKISYICNFRLAKDIAKNTHLIGIQSTM